MNQFNVKNIILNTVYTMYRNIVEGLGHFQTYGVCTKQARIAETLHVQCRFQNFLGECLLRELSTHYQMTFITEYTAHRNKV